MINDQWLMINDLKEWKEGAEFSEQWTVSSERRLCLGFGVQKIFAHQILFFRGRGYYFKKFL